MPVKKVMTINLVFWSLQLLIFFSLAMYVANGYHILDKSYPYKQLEIFNYCLSTIVSFIDNLLIINAFKRLKRYLGH